LLLVVVARRVPAEKFTGDDTTTSTTERGLSCGE
jgi:hypothetical protein